MLGKLGDMDSNLLKYLLGKTDGETDFRKITKNSMSFLISSENWRPHRNGCGLDIM
jgi:hypothetical protein